jgi:hypothetical protein
MHSSPTRARATLSDKEHSIKRFVFYSCQEIEMIKMESLISFGERGESDLSEKLRSDDQHCDLQWQTW